MSPRDRDPDTDGRRDEKSEVLTRRRLQRPPLFRVIFHNDDYTTRDFVVMALTRFFNKSHAEATRLMLEVHHHGRGVAGVYPYDMAATKKAQVEALARRQEMPLRLSLEPESGGDLGGEGEDE